MTVIYNIKRGDWVDVAHRVASERHMLSGSYGTEPLPNYGKKVSYFYSIHLEEINK